MIRNRAGGKLAQVLLFSLCSFCSLCFCLAIGAATISGAEAAAIDLDSIGSWRDLNAVGKFSHGDSFRTYQFELTNGSKASLFVAELSKWNVVPAINSPTAPTTVAVDRELAVAGINGGFFNLSNGESTSYVVIDGKQVTEPRSNQALVGNPKLKPYLETIFNRSELRIVSDNDGRPGLVIAPHNAPLAKNQRLVGSIQGGPRLLPDLTDEAEAFLRKNADGTAVDSIGSRRTAARTAI
ncbi:MAG TPA: hypothetical protein V6C72_05135, partial [Chroococcales cyanobacterium]